VTAVCIAGMHRSGTSLVARVLHDCGFDLGPSRDLMPAGPDNPEGFWENLRFVRVNDRVLARLGGSWSEPPALEPGWERSPELGDVREEAVALAGSFSGLEAWAWKDPRNSLTLSFWRGLVPDLKPVICVRHPAEVVSSLQRRTASEPLFGRRVWLTYNPRVLAVGPIRKSVAAFKRLTRGPTWGSPDESMQLWAAYYRAALAAVPADERLVTHYESFLFDAPQEVRRLLSFVDAGVDESDVERAAAAVSDELRRERRTADAALPPDVEDRYELLCSEAGPVFRKALMASSPAPGSAAPRAR
jgi:hypothetical protein